jgi:hypothetical protein
MNDHAKPLGRLAPPDRKHEELYPITAIEPQLRPKHAPVILGIPWFEGFDKPQPGADGKLRIAATGSIRGGHCTCLEPAPQPDEPGGEQDEAAWWSFYDQGVEGACEGFGHARAMSLLHRATFDAFWLYDDARRLEDRFPEGEGATNRATAKALVQWGAHFQEGDHAERQPWSEHAAGTRIKTYRWLQTVEAVREALGFGPEVGEFPLLNSWGKGGYPAVVYLPDDALSICLKEEGEAEVFTDV